jgi:hypothetical protein
MTTVFQSGETLHGRVYPYPASPGLFFLDFIVIYGARVLDDPGVTVYDLGTMEQRKRKEVKWSGQGFVGFFLLSATRAVEIVDGYNRKIKRISFCYPKIPTAIPVIE